MATKKEQPENKGATPPIEQPAMETPQLNLGEIAIEKATIPSYKEEMAILNGQKIPLAIIQEGQLYRKGIIAPIGALAIHMIEKGNKTFLIDCTEQIRIKNKWDSLASRFRSFFKEEDKRRKSSYFKEKMKCKGFKKGDRYFLLFKFP